MSDESDDRIDGFDQSPALTVMAEGADLRLVAGSRVFLDLLGERAIGLPLRQAFAGVEGESLSAVCDEVLDSGRPQSYEEFHLRSSGPDGGHRELYLDFALAPWLAPTGDTRGIIATAVDVTSQVLARRSAEASRDVAARQLTDARTLVAVMQDALLPEVIPVLPRLDVAARYLLAADDATWGGDWFDTVVRPNGTVALVVGDVVGHGSGACATMGQLRAVVHERLTSTANLDEALADVDRFAGTVPEARAATLCVVELDPATGRAWYGTAGHPPPLVVDDDPRYLEPTGGGPLGTGGGVPVLPFHLEGDDALVVLYTDGVLERPGASPASSTVELAAVVQQEFGVRAQDGLDGRRLTERVCEVALEQMTSTSGYDDDVTILAARQVQPPAPLLLRLPAVPHALAEARLLTSDWLDALHVRAVDRVGVLHATNELLSNVVSHAYAHRPRPGPMHLSLGLADTGDLEVVVRDEGAWKAPDEADGEPSGRQGGRGLAMARAFLDTLQVEHDSGGTTVTGSIRLARPAQLVTHTQQPLLRVVHEIPFEVVERPGRITVRGAVLQPDAEALERVIRRASRAGTTRTVVDLDGVTHLGSAAVQVLHWLMAGQGTHVTLTTSNGSVAQHVLDLVNLPYDRADFWPTRHQL